MGLLAFNLNRASTNNQICFFTQMVKVNSDNQAIAVASHMELCEKLVTRKDFELEVSLFFESQSCPVLIVMGLEIADPDTNEEKKIKRDILLMPANANSSQKILIGLNEISELKLSKKESKINNAVLFVQGDVTYSRKKIIPLLISILAN